MRSLKQFAKSYVAPKKEGSVFSHWHLEIRGPNGKLKHSSHWTHNLTTDTATGFTNRRDWQSKALGGGSAPVATMTGTATAVTSTVLTNSGASFPTAGQGLAGMIVVAGPNASGTGAVAFAVVQSNTSTALTVDAWLSGGTWGAGTTPNGTATYTLVPGNAPAMWQAVTSDATAPAASDTVLTSEATTNGFARKLGTWAHTAAASSYTISTSFTATGSLTVNKESLFAASIAGNGAMPFESAVPSPPVAISGDTVALVVTCSI